MTGPGGNPLLVDVIVDHHAGTGGRDTLLWSLVTETGNMLVSGCGGCGCHISLYLQTLHQTKDDIKYLNGRLRLEDNVSVVASPTINGPHSLTTDLLPLLSASIFTSAKNLIR